MLIRLKLLIKLKLVKFKMEHYKKVYTVSWKKYSELFNDYTYINEHLHPEETWEMRAEREARRGNLS